MSDNEGGKKSGYRVEYASSARAKCNGPKPCKGTTIGKGDLRFGSLVDFRGNTNFSWRHWGCVTSKIITNVKNSFNEADELDGFDDLNKEDQDRVVKAWEEGHVAPEDVPESAKKADGDDEEDEDEKPKKKGGKKKAAEEDDDGKGVFKFEYASSGRSKCKACGDSIGKDFFRLGNEVDFRGNKSFAWRHWGCAEPKLVEKLKASYGEASEVVGFADLQEGEKEKVQRAWEEGKIPEDDKGPGEAVETGKKKAAPRKKKDDNGEEKPKRSRAKKAAAADDDDLDDDMDVDEKPKKGRGAAKSAKAKAAPKKASKKKKNDDDDEDGEDFGDELAAIDDEEIDEEDEEPEETTKKRKRAPTSKGASSSKPPSKRAKPASTSKSAKPASKAKPASSRGRKKVEEAIDEEDEDDD